MLYEAFLLVLVVREDKKTTRFYPEKLPFLGYKGAEKIKRQRDTVKNQKTYPYTPKRYYPKGVRGEALPDTTPKRYYPEGVLDTTPIPLYPFGEKLVPLRGIGVPGEASLIFSGYTLRTGY